LLTIVWPEAYEQPLTNRFLAADATGCLSAAEEALQVSYSVASD
jgi:hypothetical protein